MHDLRSYCTYRDIWYTDGFRFSWRWTKIGTIKQGIEMVKKLAQGILKQLLKNYFYHPQQLKFWQHSQKVIPWDTPESMSYSWLSEALDLSHMVMDIRKQLKITVFIIPINFCFNNIALRYSLSKAWIWIFPALFYVVKWRAKAQDQTNCKWSRWGIQGHI